MEKNKLKYVLKDVIKKAREINIPVPDIIYEDVIVNKRPKKRFGCCKKKNGIFYIEISEFILSCDDSKIEEVIAHEILHTCSGCYEHGKKWKEFAKSMNDEYGYNIKRVSSFEEMGLKQTSKDEKEEIKYIIKCRKCGKVYPRKRFTCVMKKINAYRCSCGGALLLYTLQKDDSNNKIVLK